MQTRHIGPCGLLIAGLLAGCASGPEAYTIRVKGEPSLNPNSQGLSTPVNVRIYQLTDRSSFDAADFDSLWEEGEVLLAEKLVDVSEHVVTTTQDMTDIVLVASEETRFIGIVGLFNQLEEPWRVCIPVEEAEDWVFAFDGFQVRKR
jgi:type VI secretion system protein VasD